MTSQRNPQAPPGGADRLRLMVRDLAAARFAAKVGTLYGNRESARANPREAMRYLARSKEITNWTYDLSNEDEVLSAVAEMLGADPHAMNLYRDELRADFKLTQAIEALLKEVPRRDHEVRYGYRVMHYCMIRVMKPETVVELGVHDGLGAAVALRALEKNRREGRPGLLLTFDTSTESGWLIPDWLRDGMISYIADAAGMLDEVLPQHGVDLMIHDIGPGIETETEMFESALRHSRGPLILRAEMDDSSNLQRFAHERGGRFVSVQENPKDHFWLGTRIGLALFEPRLCGKATRPEDVDEPL